MQTYAFSFEAFNLIAGAPADAAEASDNYRYQTDSVDVTVVASTEIDARQKAKELVDREVFKLENVRELSQLRVAR